MASRLLADPISISKSFSPGHVTGLFEKPPQYVDDSLLMGSRGAGFSVDRGITTSVQVYDNPRRGYRIFINGREAESQAEVSKWVLEYYLKLLPRDQYFISVDHEVGIPIGFGLGSSGAAALSLSYALNKAFRLGLTQDQAAQVAHRAEIACRTGLGTVIAEFAGGFEVRTAAGAPGVGRIWTTPLKDYRAIILCLSPISTKQVLSRKSSAFRTLAGQMLSELEEDRSPENFLAKSADFSHRIGLTSGRCKLPIAALEKAGIASSVALFGETVFTLVPKSMSQKAMDALRGFGGILLS
ncbi:MAG TPA: hypothetical protein VFA15_00275, partial [Nitrososphaera sp.]|nr:hypothetical protein [Nitrososphaera sp.]